MPQRSFARIYRLSVACVVVCLSTAPGKAEEQLIGRATVIDGDTIEIHGTRIRLKGIDAPEDRQLCLVDGKPWRCGQQAALALADKLSDRTVTCESNNKDLYDRLVATCFVGREDINGWMVSEGWALAYRHYSTAYVDDEDAARKEHRGIWRGEFEAPWGWRKRQRAGE